MCGLSFLSNIEHVFQVDVNALRVKPVFDSKSSVKPVLGKLRPTTEESVCPFREGKWFINLMVTDQRGLLMTYIQ